jgi:parallel beta-helix repeat protein
MTMALTSPVSSHWPVQPLDSVPCLVARSRHCLRAKSNPGKIQMKTLLRSIAGAVLLAIATLGPTLPSPALAAQSYDNCTGFIDSLPATLTTQGTWCLRHDLATGITSGKAITVATNNVTIDCNDFKLGGTSAGLGTTTSGIASSGKLNTTIRHCNIRGFYQGIALDGSSDGSIVEDNRFDGNTSYGISLTGDNNVIRRNSVSDTGGSTFNQGAAYGIYSYGSSDIQDNTVSGVAPYASGTADAFGIFTDSNSGGSIQNNRVRALVWAGSASGYGIYNQFAVKVSLTGNVVVGLGAGYGLRCTDSNSRAWNNIVNGYTSPIFGCRDDGNSI